MSWCLAVHLRGLFTGTLLHQEPQTVQVIIVCGVMDRQIAHIVSNSDVAVTLRQAH